MSTKAPSNKAPKAQVPKQTQPPKGKEKQTTSVTSNNVRTRAVKSTERLGYTIVQRKPDHPQRTYPDTERYLVLYDKLVNSIAQAQLKKINLCDLRKLAMTTVMVIPNLESFVPSIVIAHLISEVTGRDFSPSCFTDYGKFLALIKRLRIVLHHVKPDEMDDWNLNDIGYPDPDSVSMQNLNLIADYEDDLINQGVAPFEAARRAADVYKYANSGSFKTGAVKARTQSDFKDFLNRRFALDVPRSGADPGSKPNAALAYNMNYQPATPTVAGLMDGIMPIHGTIPIASVVRPTGTGVDINLQPITGSDTLISFNHFIDLSSYDLGNRLYDLVRLFAQVRYRKFKLIYTPNIGANTDNPTLAFAWSPDPGIDSGSISSSGYVQTLENDICCATTAWSPCELDIPANSNWLYTTILRDTGDTIVESISDRMTAAGTIMMYPSAPITNLSGSAIPLGTLYLRFEADVRWPNQPFNDPSTSSLRLYNPPMLQFLFSKIRDPVTFYDVLKKLGYEGSDVPPTTLRSASRFFKLHEDAFRTFATKAIVPSDPSK